MVDVLKVHTGAAVAEAGLWAMGEVAANNEDNKRHFGKADASTGKSICGRRILLALVLLLFFDVSSPNT